jgi:hypothetical protein
VPSSFFAAAAGLVLLQHLRELFPERLGERQDVGHPGFVLPGGERLEEREGRP